MKTPSSAPGGLRDWYWALWFCYLFNCEEKVLCNSVFKRRFDIKLASTSLLVLDQFQWENGDMNKTQIISIWICQFNIFGQVFSSFDWISSAFYSYWFKGALHSLFWVPSLLCYASILCLGRNNVMS